MAQVLVSRELYADTPHEAAKEAEQQAKIWDESEHLGLYQDYYPTVDMEAADLYIDVPEGESEGMLEELLEFIDELPDLSLSVSIRLTEDDDEERYERFWFYREVV